MAELSDFSTGLRLFLKAYPWRRIDPVPWSPLARPLSESRLALISSAAFVLPDQVSFDDSIRGGDVSYREIPADIDVTSLRETHRSDAFDHRGLAEDPNLGFPLDRLRELATKGRFGSLARSHISLMGSITAPGRLIRDTAPAVARLLREDAVDAALLIPV